ncbi:MAG: molybdopterin-dependent oxidoreductase [Acidobacteria bacterium]|nr:molybdopterin-dependent oxidoreductase [Acidobacteriota bacterium]
MTLQHTHCPMDCPDTCSIEVDTSGPQVRLSGGSNSPTHGFICGKVAHFHRRLDPHNRILTPLRRSGPKGSGQFEPASWDDVLTAIVDRFQQLSQTFGPACLLPVNYGGSNGVLSDGIVDQTLFARLGASDLDRTICAAMTTTISAEMYGKMPGPHFSALAHAALNVVWGANPKASNIHLVPFLKEARKAGGKLVVIDPIARFSAHECDLHLALRPGSDAALALALIQHFRENNQIDHTFLAHHTDHADVLFRSAAEWSIPRAAEFCGLAEQDILTLAFWLVEAQPAWIRCGWGLERNRNGGRSIAAVLAIPAVLNLFQKGGGYLLSNSGAARLKPSQVFSLPATDRRLINMSQLAHALETLDDPPLKGLFIYNANPVATLPNQKKLVEHLQREDLFSVVFDQVFTDSALLADWVLPATTFLEHFDLRAGYGTLRMAGVQPVMPPVGESRSNVSVFQELAKRFGFDDPVFLTPEPELIRQIAATSPLLADRSLDTLVQGGGIELRPEDPQFFIDAFPLTPNQKINLAPPSLNPSGYAPEPAKALYPFQLISPATGHTISSTFGEFEKGPLPLHMNPEDAARLGLRPGDRVKAWNDLAEVHFQLHVTSKIRPGVVMSPKGLWRKQALNGWTVNALCPDHVCSVGGGACYFDAQVAVAAVEA